jgi:hypothetical protein
VEKWPSVRDHIDHSVRYLLSKDFLLVPGNPPEFVEALPVPQVAGGHDVRACCGARAGGSVVSLWHYLGTEGKLTVASDKVSAIGHASPELRVSSGKTGIPIGGQRTLVQFASLTPEQVSELLAKATFEARPPATLWIEAESFTRIEGKMSTGTAAKVLDPQARGDFVVGTGSPRSSGEPDGSCEYRIAIPHAGLWTLWARVRYPRGGDMSFSVDLPGPEGETVRKVLGNCGQAGTVWHWTASGGGVDTRPPGSPIQVKLKAGECVLRIHPREGHGSAPVNPRLDALCLTEDPNYVPKDED